MPIFETKRFLRDEIVHLTYRVKELEERLCPCEGHDWKEIDHRFSMIQPNDMRTVRYLKCKRCGKEREEWDE